MFQDFGRRCLADVKSLKIMIQAWADEEDREIEMFESNRNKGQHNNNHNNGQCNDKNCNDRPNNDNRNNYSGGHNRKRKLDNIVGAILQSSKKGGGKNQDRPSFNELLKKQCPWHPYHKHSAIDCFSLHRVMKDLPEPSDIKDKGKVKEDKDDGDNGKLQNPSNTINFIFGGTPGTATKQSQKLTLRELMFIEPATPMFLKWPEVPITFSRKDQWSSFSDPGWYPLVMDPLVAGSRLTKILINGGSGLNVLFAKTLKKMSLDITDMLTPTNSLFYGIIPGNAAVPVGQVVLTVTFGTTEHYRT
ncbi:uncharacterized protein [Setaria viridis]|uniref:uncharacterized protein isoform X2 n=1 Tax=Setaria viridis TaxID=4556 RepID=UPI003B3A4EDC